MSKMRQGYCGRKSKKGKLFYGCSGYPDCDQSYWYKPVDKNAQNVGHFLIEKKTKAGNLACSMLNATTKSSLKGIMEVERMVEFHATTICAVRRGPDDIAIGGDGQVTMGETAIMKNGAKK